MKESSNFYGKCFVNNVVTGFEINVQSNQINTSVFR